MLHFIMILLFSRYALQCSHCYSIDLFIFFTLDAFILCYLYIVLPGPFGSNPFNFGVVGIITDHITPEGEAFYGTLIAEDY